MTYAKKNILPRLKIWLLKGKSITHDQAKRMWHTNRLAEYIRRLRKSGMNIETKMETFGNDVYGVYKLIQKQKVDRIKTRAYMDQY